MTARGMLSSTLVRRCGSNLLAVEEHGAREETADSFSRVLWLIWCVDVHYNQNLVIHQRLCDRLYKSESKQPRSLQPLSNARVINCSNNPHRFLPQQQRVVPNFGVYAIVGTLNDTFPNVLFTADPIANIFDVLNANNLPNNLYGSVD